MYLKLLRTKLRKSHKGEISIYLSLVFTLIISLTLAVITGARGAALQVAYECAVESALLSAFGEYNRELLERYDVFFIDLSYLSNSPDPKNLEARLNEYFDDNFHPEEDTNFLFYSDILDVTDTNVSLSEYELATDRYGKPFAKQAVEYMRNLVGINDITEMADLVAVWDSYDLDTEKYEKIKDEAASKITYSDDDTWEQTAIKDNYLSWIDYDYGAIGIMGKDYFSLSNAKIDGSYTLLKRSKEQGSGDLSEFSFDPTENILFTEYIMQKTGDYIHPKDDTHLKYETEYIIFGRTTDLMNMTDCVKTMFYVRAFADYISLNMASDKVEVVQSASELISAITEIPEPVITQVVLLIWGEMEALTDMKSLLKGEGVPLIKTSDQINVSVSGLIGLLGGSVDDDAADAASAVSSDGIPTVKVNYNGYMRLFLYYVPSFVKTYRTMDIIEFNLRDSGTGNEFFRFDVCADKVKAVFSVETGFDFRFYGEKKYSYF